MILNKFSRIITQSKKQGASQAMLHACGLSSVDLDKPQIGVVSTWLSGNPCNMHLRTLGDHVSDSLSKQNLQPMSFNTAGVSDGISMGTDGMSYSLPSRDIIADSIETTVRGQWYDGFVALAGCDKNMPGCAIAMVRIDRPSILIYGGTIAPGKIKNKELDIVDAFQSYGQSVMNLITENERQDIIRNACPGAGACGGMYTANTMATALEVLGLTLPSSSSYTALSDEKLTECKEIIGKEMLRCLETDWKPSRYLTRQSFLNAIAVVNVLSGSTNAVLHLLCIARTANIKLTIEDFNSIADTVPILGNLKPSGKYRMNDLCNIGGTPAVVKYLIENNLIDGSQLTVTGNTLWDRVKNAPTLDFNSQDIIHPISSPIAEKGNIRILTGNLAPEGSVAKITGKEGEYFSGPANCFDSEEDMLSALENRLISDGDVIVIRYEGPKGGPGMPEMLSPTSAIVGAGLGNKVALITDGRFSGGSHGFIVGHIAPEAIDNGPIGLIQNGDIITIDARTQSINHNLSQEELLIRSKLTPKVKKIHSGYLKKWISTVSSAGEGCHTTAPEENDLPGQFP